MFPKKGNTFQKASRTKFSQAEYRDAICAVLTDELGDTHQAVKTIMQWTGASERTAKNWMKGFHAPAGEHLITLMRNSDAVLTMVLLLCGRNETIAVSRINYMRQELKSLLQALDEIDSSRLP
ncbi:MAG: hypothetical protein ABJ327_24330 [Litoreibacter sp.]